MEKQLEKLPQSKGTIKPHYSMILCVTIQKSIVFNGLTVG